MNSGTGLRCWVRLFAVVIPFGGMLPARADLSVVNGDFSDLSGLVATQDQWYGGCPAGWLILGRSAYAVHAARGPTPPTCNVQGLGFVYQHLGVLSTDSDVTVTFDVSEPWRTNSLLRAWMMDGDFRILARSDAAPGERGELVARAVPAGTAIVIGFSAVRGNPGLDNVRVATGRASRPAERKTPIPGEVTVACYYFPNYHPTDARNRQLKGPNWSEWELVRAACPRFPNHAQPKVPRWGYEDESDPVVMARKIAAAADHGIGVFIFDWYYYDDGPFLERALDQGFLCATNNHRIRFALMWANHDWKDIHPLCKGHTPAVLYPGRVKPETWERITDLVIQRYFKHPSYWTLGGCPYFSFYDLTRLLESFGSVQATRAALDRFRAKARAAGFPGVNLNAIVWGRTVLPGEQVPADPVALVRELGFDSVGSYVWVHHVALPELVTDYDRARDAYLWYWNEAEGKFPVPYHPNITMGWDPSPRTCQKDPYGPYGYPFTNTIGGNTPERFRVALEIARRRLMDRLPEQRVVTINAWNEWTEGSYLEPDTVHGFGYLEAIRSVFGGQNGNQ